MPTTLTIPLTTTERLFFDEAWPLERVFVDLLAGEPRPLGEKNGLKPYTLSPLWPKPQRRVAVSDRRDRWEYDWRVCLLDETLTPNVVARLEAGHTLDLDGRSLAVGSVGVETCCYEQVARQAQAKAKTNAKRYFDFEFLTPVILRRQALPFPVPDPVVIFHHYLLAWDTFAPRELWVNINTLDAIEAHLALVEHRLETRPVLLAGERPKTGFLGQATYKMMAWEKLGEDFLGTLHMLAHFAEFCGTGQLTACGLGQTRYRSKRNKRH